MMGGIKNAKTRRNRKAENDDLLFEPKRGLRYAPVEVPAGVRGRLAVIGNLIESADAAIIMEGGNFGFGCGGCARTNEIIPYIVSQQGIPYVKVNCPTDYETAKAMVKKIRDFLAGLGDAT